MTNDYMTTRELAARWGVSRQRIQRLCAEGRLPRIQMGGAFWFRKQGIDALRPERKVSK
jgi:excisionase family DNA binding protein